MLNQQTIEVINTNIQRQVDLEKSEAGQLRLFLEMIQSCRHMYEAIWSRSQDRTNIGEDCLKWWEQARRLRNTHEIGVLNPLPNLPDNFDNHAIVQNALNALEAWAENSVVRLKALEILERLAVVGKHPNTLPVRGVNGSGVMSFSSLPAVVPTYGTISSENTSIKNATATSVPNLQTRQKFSRADREKIVSDAITQLLSPAKRNKATIQALTDTITLDELVKITDLKRTTISETQIWITFEATRKARITAPKTGNKPARQLTKTMLEVRVDEGTESPLHQLEQTELETQYRNQCTADEWDQFQDLPPVGQREALKLYAEQLDDLAKES